MTTYRPSASELIAAELLDGESVDMGGWKATFADAVYSACERGDDFANQLRLFVSGQMDAEAARKLITDAVHDYAERNEADWISACQATRADDAIRARDEERLLRQEGF